MQGEGASIRTGVGHDQDDRVDAAVALLEGYPPLERLDVPECCFRLACGDTSILRCDAVSGAAVPGQRKRNLGAPDGPVRQAGPESFEQSTLAFVTDRITVRIRLDDEAQSDRRASPAQLIDVQFVEDAAFDPTELRM